MVRARNHPSSSASQATRLVGSASKTALSGKSQTQYTSTPALARKGIARKGAKPILRAQSDSTDDSESDAPITVSSNRRSTGSQTALRAPIAQGSRTPASGYAKARPPLIPPSASLDKGKGRARNDDDEDDPFEAPKSTAGGVTSLVRQRDQLRASSTSEDELNSYRPQSMASTSKLKPKEIPVQTPPNNRKVHLPRDAAVAGPSSILRTATRGRVSAGTPGRVLSAMKPIPMKTVVLSSPPRLHQSPESDSSSDSEDDIILLKEEPTPGNKKRKAAVGEYEWDERSRSCVPKRERSRSRSLATSANRQNRSEATYDDNSPASDRSHLQERMFPTSENDLLKNLLTNRLHARARQAETVTTKPEYDAPNVDVDMGNHLSDGVGDSPHEDVYSNLPEMPEPYAGFEDGQPLFDFEANDFPEDNGPDIVGRLTVPPHSAMSVSSDDGFENSVIHLHEIDIDNAKPQLTASPERGLADRQVSLDVKLEGEEPVLPVQLQNDSSMAARRDVVERDVATVQMEATEERPLSPKVKPTDAEAITGMLSPRAPSFPLADEPPQAAPATIQQDELRELRRSSSVLSSLPPSSPPPLPSARSSLAPSDRATSQSPMPQLESDEAPAPLSHKSNHVPTASFLASKTHLDELDPTGRMVGSPSRSLSPQKVSKEVRGCKRTPSQSPAPSIKVISPAGNSPSRRSFSVLSDLGATPRSVVRQAKSPPPISFTAARPRSLTPIPTSPATHISEASIPLPAALEHPGSAAERFTRLPADNEIEGIPLSGQGYRDQIEYKTEESALSWQAKIAQLRANPPDTGRRSPSRQPSPFLTFRDQQHRSPSPNIRAENATSDFLARVRALRSPGTYRPRGNSQEVVNSQLKSDAEHVAGLASVSSNTDYKRPSTVVPHASDAALVDSTTHSEVMAEDVPENNHTEDFHGASPGTDAVARDDNSELKATGADKGLASTKAGATMLVDAEDADQERLHAIDHSVDNSATDSEEEEAEVERSLSQARTPSRSPAAVRRIIPLEDPQLSPNVTKRQARSRSCSTNSSRSAKSNHRKSSLSARSTKTISFSDLNAFESSPVSMAASVGRRTFDALQSSSDDENSDRESPAKKHQNEQPGTEQTSGTSEKSLLPENSSDSSEEEDRFDLSSSPTQAPTMSALGAVSPSAQMQRLPKSSTPARLLNDLSIKTTETHAVTEAAVAESQCIPSTSQQLLVTSTMSAHQVPVSDRNHDLDSAPEAINSAISVTAQSAVSADIDIDDDVSHASSVSTGDSPTVLDAARPRTALAPPALLTVSRPTPARRSPRNRVAHSTPGKSTSATNMTTLITSPELPSHTHMQQPAHVRSQSVVSQQESVASQASTTVKVSSVDPKAAARAAAILKIHHHYIHDGFWPAGVNPVSRAASGSSEEGERALDDLLRQAEREVSMQLQEGSPNSQQYLDSSQECPSASVSSSTTAHAEEHRERSVSASRHIPDHTQSRAWTRFDWRALEQCFIDELRRKRMTRESVDPAEVVRLYLDNEQMETGQCVGEWDPTKLEVRVQALLARKNQKATSLARRERSQSIVSSVGSRAPSEFFMEEELRINDHANESSSWDASKLQIPGSLPWAIPRRYARSAEPVAVHAEPRGNHQEYSRYRSVSKYQAMQRKTSQYPSRLSRERSLESVAEETQSIASEPPPSRSDRTGVLRLYPSLEDLKLEVRPKKLLPVKGRSVAANVSLFEKIEEEQSLEVQKETAWLKRKASQQDLLEATYPKRART